MKKSFQKRLISVAEPSKTKHRIIGLFLVMLISFGVSAQVNIVNLGADNTGKNQCDAIINSAIDSLHAIGGGEVYFPAGQYLSGPIEMKSNITLNLEAGAVLKFTDDFDDYLPMIDSRWEGIRVKTFKSPIYAHNAKNITIKGRGLIDGNGEKWWDFWWPLKRGEASTNSKWEQEFYNNNKELIEKNAYLQKMGNFLRPPLFMPYECENVRIEGVSFQNPPFWTIMPAFSENITIDGITIINPEDSPNTDGIDPSSCKNVRISNCHISVGDDCIVIKSGRDEDGREANVATENITITNCTMMDGHGGVVIGSEMSGSVRRVTISNCVFKGTDRGIRFKTMRGRGGYIEDVCISNIVMYDILKQGIMMNMRYHETPVEQVSERTPTIRNISIDNIRINKAKQAIAFLGLEERSIQNIRISGVNVNANQGIFGEYASDIDLSDIRIKVDKGIPVEFKKSEAIQLKGLTVTGEKLEHGAVALSEVKNMLITDCFQSDAMDFFMDVDEASESIYLINNVFPGVSKTTLEKTKVVYQKGNILSK
ncbi:glycoside hydrolase family 28 protein [Carboxylicivirga sp. A043]|uniref:glycoside hydrolase family 28 protein n=1 Tax=Carboxylicivirga litoralis TaxID=2816963 RepID=UPI0021CB33AF|nr:glycoside hydrolase family 28 protein [Carboxylicivirga sp. A043]MCU4158026.1 glycoside hydrolase family 28 protein [Carboxylicivirga sp. A043]